MVSSLSFCLILQGSDVYAFALVLWEIITGLVPFGDVKKQDDIRAKVCFS